MNTDREDELLLPPQPRREDGDPPKKKLNPKDAEPVGKIVFYTIMALMFLYFGYMLLDSNTRFLGFIGTVSTIIAFCVVVVDSKHLKGWGWTVELLGCVLLVIIGWSGHQQAEKLKKERDAAVNAQKAAENERDIVKTELEALKKAPAPSTATPAPVANPLTLTPAILAANVKRVDKKTVELTPITGVDWTITMKSGSPGLQMSGVGKDSAAKVEVKAGTGGKLVVVYENDIPDTAAIYLTKSDGSEAGNDLPLPK